MRILLLGATGQVGWELQRSLAPLGELIALSRDSADYCGDLLKPDQLARTVQGLKPDAIVNAAAHTAVDRAESEPDLAGLVNAAAPGVLASEAARCGAWLLHYSSDYVFDGSGQRPWAEDDAPAPLSVYGRTKLEGEEAIRKSGCKHLIFRTSWVYAARGGNFARTMLRLAAERERLSVVDDQIGAPTGADLVADVSALALRLAGARPELSATYHLVAAGETSWHGYTRFVLDWARQRGMPIRVAADAVERVASSEFPTAARRPLNSRLDTQRLQRQFGLTMPPWQRGVERMLAEVTGL